MARSCLLGLLHDKALNISSRSEKADDGSVISLMSSDVETLLGTAAMFHDSWAHLLEVLVGMALLARNVGWISPILLVTVFGMSLSWYYYVMLQHADAR